MLEVREIAPGLLQVVGSVDLTTVSVFREKLGDAVDRAEADGMPVLSVDLHAVEFLDAAGLGVLFGAHRRARRGGGQLRLTRLTPELRQTMLVSRLYRVLDIEYGTPSIPDSVPTPRPSGDERRPLASS
ncbi:MAG TPA: STAS domain-containing protein [Frankiaceae bacterium]|nr:STAS domain-containing protein [Frankiaceae bacterium]